MTIDELKEYFGSSYHFKKVTGMSASSFLNWCNWGYIPVVSQIKLERLTGGKLKADFSQVEVKK
jgi:hypothetical protein